MMKTVEEFAAIYPKIPIETIKHIWEAGFDAGRKDTRKAAKSALEREYNELLYAVARKFPGETRHQSALRYIQEAEQRAGNETGSEAGSVQK